MRAPRFVDELGIEPGPELKELQAEILRQDSALARVATRGRAHATRTARSSRRCSPAASCPCSASTARATLAERLAHGVLDYPDDRPLDLARVSSTSRRCAASGRLYDELHDRFEAAIEPSPLHRFLASSAAAPARARRTAPADRDDELRPRARARVRGGGGGARRRLVRRERAATAGGSGTGRRASRRGRSRCRTRTRRALARRAHGPAEAPRRRRPAARARVGELRRDRGRLHRLPRPLGARRRSVPVTLAARLRRSHFLFLGYEMADWNLRLVLNRVWGGRTSATARGLRSRSPSALEQRLLAAARRRRCSTSSRMRSSSCSSARPARRHRA